MSNEITEPTTLSEACEKILAGFDMFSQEVNCNGTVEVFTTDGDFCFAVMPTIAEYDLRTVINYARGRVLAGERAGRDGLAESFRSLIGAAKAA
jgi:hypothetical protein